MVQQSSTGGVKPISIAGRFVSERERLAGMTDAERAFRKQYLQDQILSPNEPKKIPQMYKELYNPIRRFYRWPLDKLEAALEPVMGHTSAHLTRYAIGKTAMFIAGTYWFFYYAKYNSNDWTRKSGWKKKEARLAVDLGDPKFPQVSDRTKPSDYASKGFKDMHLNL